MIEEEDKQMIEDLMSRYDHLDRTEQVLLEKFILTKSTEEQRLRYDKVKGDSEDAIRKRDYVAQMKEARKSIYDNDFVDYDFDKPRNDEEYYMRGRTPKDNGGKGAWNKERR
jgi:hypothetical protein